MPDPERRSVITSVNARQHASYGSTSLQISSSNEGMLSSIPQYISTGEAVDQLSDDNVYNNNRRPLPIISQQEESHQRQRQRRIEATQSINRDTLSSRRSNVSTISSSSAAHAAAPVAAELTFSFTEPLTHLPSPQRGNTTDPPPSATWEEDTASKLCRGCYREFSLLRRRHHCRACGMLYCSTCCPHVTAASTILNTGNDHW